LQSVEFVRRQARAITAYNLARPVQGLVEALRPFAECAEQISDDEDDEEWAKFRLLIKNYRAARTALANWPAP
jgi:hypothetical protein